MRSAALVLVSVGAAVGVGAARAEPWAEPDPAAVVGQWSGKAAWHGCPVSGPPRVTVPVARDGGGYRIGLGAVLDGLGDELLAPTGASALEATHDDLHVTWEPGKPGRAAVHVRFASGCEGTLALARASTGVAVCDEAVALTAIGATCDALTPPALADADRAAVTRLGPPLRGKQRAAASAVCRRVAPPLRAALVAAGCVPTPDDPSLATVRIAECDALVASVDRMMRCDRVPVAMKQRLRVSMARVDHWAAAPRDDAEVRDRAAATCADTRHDLDDTLTVLGCN